MNGDEILRLVDTLHRSKEIEKETIFQGIEAALLSAVKKRYGDSEEAHVTIDRRTGEPSAFDGENEVAIDELGRLAAMSGKQVLFQKIREAERDRIFEEYEEKVRTIVVGIVQRQEGPNLIINLGKVEGFLPRSEQAPGERFKVGDRIKVLIKDLRKNANRVKITLSRTHPDLVRNLFEVEVPEIAEKVIEVKEISREPGYRTKIAVTTHDANVDCVGACVGVRGSRIKNIVDELFGEKIDIVRWNESIEVLIMNALKPAEISSMDLDFEQRKALIYVRPDQQSLAIGKRGQNVRLASKLTGWELDIVPVTEEDLERLRKEEIDQEGELTDTLETTLGRSVLPGEEEDAVEGEAVPAEALERAPDDVRPPEAPEAPPAGEPVETAEAEAEPPASPGEFPAEAAPAGAPALGEESASPAAAPATQAVEPSEASEEEERPVADTPASAPEGAPEETAERAAEEPAREASEEERLQTATPAPAPSPGAAPATDDSSTASEEESSTDSGDEDTSGGAPPDDGEPAEALSPERREEGG